MWPFRLLLRLVAFVFLVATFALASMLAFDLPGLLASGRIDPRIPHDMQQDMGVENWPFVVRSLGSIGLFVLGCVSILFIMWVRRSRGATHLLRGIAGAALLFAAPFVLAHHGINWGLAIEPVGNGWGAWQEFVQGLSPGAGLRAAMIFVGAMVLLLWPAAPRAVASPEQPAPAAGSSPIMAAGAHK